jgi:glycosyltransferase involved in cell wall biosynthesis
MAKILRRSLQLNSVSRKIGVIGLRGFPHVMGGVERHCEQIYPRLSKLGYTVYVCRRKNYLDEKSLFAKYEHIKFIDLWTPRQKHLEALFHSFLCIVILRMRGVRVVHIHSFGPAVVAPLAKLFGLSVVMTYHLPNYLQGKWSGVDKYLLKLAELIACRFSDRIIAVSKTNRNIIKTNTGRESIFIPNGVNLPEKIEGSLSNYSLEKKKYIFTACRFVPEKGVDVLINAFNKLETDWKLVIAGTADHVSKYSNNVIDLAKKNSKIVLPGFMTGYELELLYSSAGIFVLPSFIEGQPISLLEAMSHGLPVIVSDIPAHRELDIADDCYVSPGDVDSLAEKLSDCLLKKQFLESGKKYRKLVNDEYNWDSIVEKTEKIFPPFFSQ